MQNSEIDWSNKTVLLTGGTGSFGQKFVEIMLAKYHPKVVRIFSRDELKQWEMEKKFAKDEKSLRFFIGDIRDKDRLDRAMNGVDIVVHAAALKQVPSCEYNPFEAIKTNILGAQNVIETAIDHNVEKVIAISTDKAVSPVNLYGATKMCMEKLFVAANSYAGNSRTRMSCVRYGNVVGSRGSVIPLFRKQKETGTITITDEKMSRFWITLDQSAEFVIKCLNLMRGYEVFVPKIPSMKIGDLARVIAPNCKIEYTGIRPGEKLCECLVMEDEARHTEEFNDFFTIEPEYSWIVREKQEGGKKLAEGFNYTSDNNSQWLTEEELKTIVEKI